MSRVSPAMERAREYIESHKGITPQILMEKVGVSRATAYNAIKKYYKEGKNVPVRGKSNEDSKRDKKKSSGDRQKTANDNNNNSKPRFELCGIHKELTKKPELEGRLLWGDIYYKGICPVCAKEVDLYKTAIVFSKSGKREIIQDFRGTCFKCDIKINISRSRK